MNALLNQKNVQSSSYQPIINILQNNGITDVAIIDDAYNPISKERLIDEIEQFQAEVEADNCAWEALEAICVEAGAEAVSLINAPDGLWQALWERHSQIDSLKPYCDNLFFSVRQDKERLEKLRQVLENDLMLNVNVYDVEVNIEQVSAQIIFLDYFLGPGQSEAKERAKRKAIEIHQKHPFTLIILMSSKEEAEYESENFRDETGLLMGLFSFISKADFTERDLLHLRFILLATDLKHSVKIQSFVEAIENTIRDASAGFIRDIKRLTLSDYSYLQRFNLRKEGQPLGDYLLWLFSLYLGHLVFERESVLDAERKLVDQIAFSANLSPQFIPSAKLLELYHCAVWNTNIPADIEPHPRQVGGTDDTPYLSLGDLLLEQSIDDNLVSKKVWLLITPECDLAFTPDEPDRKAKSGNTLLFLPGELKPFDKSLNTKLQSDFLKYEGGLYQIQWEHKRLTTITFGTFREWHQDKRRIARLRAPYIFEIQRIITSEISRIGVPVAPSVYRRVSIHLLSGEKDQVPVEVLPVRSDAALIVTKRDGKQHCRLLPEFVSQLPGLLAARLRDLEKNCKRSAENGFEPLVSKIEALQELLNVKCLLEMLDEFELSGNPDKPRPIAKKIAICKAVGTVSKYPVAFPYFIRVMGE